MQQPSTMLFLKYMRYLAKPYLSHDFTDVKKSLDIK